MYIPPSPKRAENDIQSFSSSKNLLDVNSHEGIGGGRQSNVKNLERHIVLDDFEMASILAPNRTLEPMECSSLLRVDEHADGGLILEC